MSPYMVYMGFLATILAATCVCLKVGVDIMIYIETRQKPLWYDLGKPTVNILESSLASQINFTVYFLLRRYRKLEDKKLIRLFNIAWGAQIIVIFLIIALYAVKEYFHLPDEIILN